MKAILGIKKGMTRVFVEDNMVPVTIVDTSGCKIAKRDGDLVELGLGKKDKAKKPALGSYKELKYVPRFTTSLRGQWAEEVSAGDDVKAEFFNEGEAVNVVGITKGKGFQGVVKRWNFKGGQRTHGQSDRLRAPGSIGAGTDPGRVWKGKKMGGTMGQDRKTLKNRKIVGISDNHILISGALPGANGDLITIYTE